MGGVDIIIIAVIAAIIGVAGWCIYKSKKNGKKCIGCPDSCACSAGNCAGGCSGCTSCGK
ncbi:MAG: FeoB-associated Cys-rich membrane protein [Oscillospiraceae bacterium]|nr:FeoB-associated Cys-rich membrane protein [Oscillospiraceae bacterium]